ncbi:sulfite exporter TauE/SafE family protein [Nocardioides sp.]|uniref:sulfite exporter TauE/SafE family protein n=1 Tax=Nocardioides sp. TaxID=35761 RepID=UPI001983D744|nr:sulfite exporter TauE/SafE family protein [Nocardioides sp.]MBC7275886.1 sulfite exporter TauE/SafE family protein [Nocardioides sp.]
MERLIIFALVGLAAQAVDGSLGMAYGVTSSTLLVATGVAPAVASASVHLAEVGTTFVSGVSHWRLGNVDWKVVGKIAIPGGVGAFAGATFLSGLSTESATPWVAGLLLLLGIYIVARFVFGKPPVFIPGRRPGLGLLAPLGLFGGFIDATGGGGWGPVTTPTLISSGTLHPRKVIGSVSTAEFVTTVAASVGFLVGLAGQALDWRIIGGLLIGGVIAAPFAAYLVKHLSLPILGGLVGSIILVTNGRTLLRSFEAESVAAYGLLFAVAAVIVAVAVRKVSREPAEAPEPEPTSV